MMVVSDRHDYVSLISTVDPFAVERAQRLAFAIDLIRRGVRQREISKIVADRFGISRITGWRISSMAQDLAGNVE